MRVRVTKGTTRSRDQWAHNRGDGLRTSRTITLAVVAICLFGSVLLNSGNGGADQGGGANEIWLVPIPLGSPSASAALQSATPDGSALTDYGPFLGPTQQALSSLNTGAAISPDRTKLAYFAASTQNVSTGVSTGTLLTSNVDGSDVQPLATGISENSGFNNITWSPDGSSIAIASSDNGNGTQDITIYPVDGSTPTVLVEPFDRSACQIGQLMET